MEMAQLALSHIIDNLLMFIRYIPEPLKTIRTIDVFMSEGLSSPGAQA